MILPELLAPAGSPEAAMAALKGGADAIYLGGRMLNARMNANNFTDDELSECIRTCHARGVKVYVTLNTSVYDRELAEAIQYADKLYEMGTDALIIADLGFVALTKGRYPGMEFHASTQASGHNAACAKALAEAGFSRMVCARELSREAIKQLCKDSPIEIEQFIHGAMCVSQSGQCMASQVMGGRSGNRGVCAQPCRMSYNGGSPLSLKDMCLASHVTDLIESGVSSLKIEGRMKSPAYVYEVTSAYRKLLDEHRNATEKEISSLAAVFSRSGFTDGYYVGKIDGSMNGVRRAEDISASRSKRTELVDLRHHLPKITVSERCVTGEVSVPKPPKRPSKPQKPILTARFDSPEQVTGQGFFSHIYLPLEKYEAGVCDGVVFPPSVFPERQAQFEQAVEKAAKNGATHALVCHVGQIETALKYGLIPHGDFRLNVFNTATAQFACSLGIRDLILSPELTLPQMRDINAPKCAIAYGKYPVMLLTKPVGAASLKDKTGAIFKVTREWGYDILLNSVPVYMADKQKDLDTYGIRARHFIFTDESAAECAKVINAYKNALPATFPIKRIAK